MVIIISINSDLITYKSIFHFNLLYFKAFKYLEKHQNDFFEIQSNLINVLSLKCTDQKNIKNQLKLQHSQKSGGNNKLRRKANALHLDFCENN